jgi:hypothetical protein
MVHSSSTPTIEPVGLGGWLLLVVLGLFRAIYVHARSLYELRQLQPHFTDQELVGPAPILMIYENVHHSAFLIVVLGSLMLMFRKSRRFPIAYIVYLAVVSLATLVWLWVDIHFERIPPGLHELTLRPLASAIIAPAIWIPYMLKSKRVANTFTQ